MLTRRLLLSLLAFGLLWTAGCRRAAPSDGISEVRLDTPSSLARIVSGVETVSPNPGWLWTGPVFTLKLDPPRGVREPFFELDFTVPEELVAAGPATVKAKANGKEFLTKTFAKGGRASIAAAVGSPGSGPLEIEVAVDHSFQGDGGKARGLIFVAGGLKDYSRTNAFSEAELARAQEAYKEVLSQRDLKFPVERQKELMRMFHDLPIWETLTYQGVRIIKNPLDLWNLQQIAWELKPDFVVETGTWQGGSALWWAQTLDDMGLDKAGVLTVDIQDLTAVASTRPMWKKHVTFRKGSSTDPKIVAEFAAMVKGKKVIVNLDSDHSMAHVLNELRLYAPLVGPGGYIAVEDTHLDGVPTHPEQGPGPMAAVLQFLKEGGSTQFERDLSREAMVMTSYPGGWLRHK